MCSCLGKSIIYFKLSTNNCNVQLKVTGWKEIYSGKIYGSYGSVKVYQNNNWRRLQVDSNGNININANSSVALDYIGYWNCPKWVMMSHANNLHTDKVVYITEQSNTSENGKIVLQNNSSSTSTWVGFTLYWTVD